MTTRRERLEARRDELRKRLASVRADLTRKREPLSADFADQATQRENDEVLEGIGRSTEIELGQLDHALRRIDSGDYGKCARCGAGIESARLDAVPYTDRCSSCAQ
jgi:RNA polymerase-binding transcription factor DksA